MLLGKGLEYVIKITMAGWFDRLLGGILGLAKGVFLVILMHMLLGTVLAPENPLLRPVRPAMNSIPPAVWRVS